MALRSLRKGGGGYTDPTGVRRISATMPFGSGRGGWVGGGGSLKLNCIRFLVDRKDDSILDFGSAGGEGGTCSSVQIPPASEGWQKLELKRKFSFSHLRENHFCELLLEKLATVRKMWKKGTIFVKIFRWQEIFAKVCFPESFRKNMCKTGENVRGSLKKLLFLRKM
jgi:hypothetical protein